MLTIRQWLSRQNDMLIVRQWLSRHPLLVAWAVLAVGMVAMLLWASQDAGLQASQLLALVVATVLLAGACVWIISWE